VGFEGYVAIPELLDRIARSELGGIILYRPNIKSPVQVAQLVRELRSHSPALFPLVISVDQEGGLVQRLKSPLTIWPDMFRVGAAGDVQRTRIVGKSMGRELRALGIGWNLAPVLDVHTNPKNPVIGSRSFGSEPNIVTDHALAFWRGLHDSGVLGCGKHYPGHGDTQADSHLELPVVNHDEARLRSIELAPFAVAASAGFEALMTAHVLYPALDPELPATISERIATRLLREELGFKGLLVSDDLGMKAVAERYPVEELVVRSLLAGVDHFLVRGPREKQEQAFAALVSMAESRSDVRARVLESAARVTRFKERLKVGMPVGEEALIKRLGLPEDRNLAASFPKVDVTLPVSSPVVDD
jgi:beta-N-acetylhexosaminidase